MTSITPYPAPSASPHLPYNLDAEQGLLAAIVASNLAYDKVADVLRPEHFYSEAFGAIFDAIGTLIEKGQRADYVTLRSFFESSPLLAPLGGAEYLTKLVGSYVSVLNAEDYARTIHDLYLRRSLTSIATETLASVRLSDIEAPATTLVEATEEKLFAIAAQDAAARGPQPFSASLKDAREAAEVAFKSDRHITGVTTGLRDLDRKLGGLQPTDLIILAGRPAMGKSALATNIAVNAARAWRDSHGQDGAVPVIFSLEMSADQLATRVIAEQAHISSNAIRHGQISAEQMAKVIEASNSLATLPLTIDDTAGLSVAALRTRARRLKRSANGLGLIVVDYLQLMQSAATRREESRVQEISEITRGLKAIAKDLHVPILALSQLSRAVEGREDKRPHLADLRESGSIEQDADIVMFIYREDYYHDRAEPVRRADESDATFNGRYVSWQEHADRIRNTAEIIIGKHRHGPVGAVELAFDPALTRFSDLAR